MSELVLSQSSYLHEVEGRFRVLDAKPINTLLGNHTIFLIMQCVKIEDKKKDMNITPYTSGVGKYHV